MKTLLTIFPGLLISINLTGQGLSNSVLEKMMLTYTFSVKQSIALEVIADRFPELKEDVRIATHDWNREFKTSVDNIDTLLTQQLKDVWTRNRTAIHDKYALADYTGTQEKDAHQFILSVMERSIGKIESPILETLLIYKPLYHKSPENEISDGFSQKYTTHNWNKSLPVNIILILPKSWNHSAGNKKNGNVLQTFVSENGDGLLSMTLTVEKGRVDFTPENVQQQLLQDVMQKTYVKTATVKHYQLLKIDDRQAACIRYYREDVKKDFKSNTLIETYVTYFKSCRIILTFTLMSPVLTETDLSPILERNERLIRKITDNVVILSQWGM